MNSETHEVRRRLNFRAVRILLVTSLQVIALLSVRELWTGAPIVRGAQITASQATEFVNGQALAGRFPGADCGAKINAADAALGKAAGEILINRDCGSSLITPVIIRNGHTLRFIQGGWYTFKAPITLSQGASIIGSGGVASYNSEVTETLLVHDFEGDLITYDGSGASQGGGSLENLTLYNIYKGADSGGTAIKITGVSASPAPDRRANWILIRRVYVGAADEEHRWTHGLWIDGRPVGAPSGVRDFIIADSRFNDAAINFENILLENAYNVILRNIWINNGRNGRQLPGITVTGDSVNRSQVVHFLDGLGGTLVIDFADNIEVIGGGYTSIKVTENAGGSNLIMPSYLGNPPTNKSPRTTTFFWLDAKNMTLRTDSTFTSKSFSLGNGVSWVRGTGAPSGPCTTGALYSRTDGARGATLYACEAGEWTAK